MKIISWEDGRKSRHRQSFLIFIKGDEVIPFHGKDIPGVVVVRGTDYTKNGWMSHENYRLALADGIRHISGYDGWETGRFVEGLGSAVGCQTPDLWTDVAKALGVSVPSAMEFMRRYHSEEANKLDEVEKALVELEKASEEKTDSIIVVVSFGSPTNRAISEGYWVSPKKIPGYDAEIRLRDTSHGWYEESNIEVVGISGTIISVKHSSGMHGGYYAVSIAVIPQDDAQGQ